MKFKTIIFNSELEFRRYVFQNVKDIFQIYVFEDVLDHIIFFYCFTQEGSIVATKEPSSNKLSYYIEMYKLLTKEFNICISPDLNQARTLKLIKE